MSRTNGQDFKPKHTEGAVSAETRYVPHQASWNDGHENFQRIRKNKLWEKLYAKRSAGADGSIEKANAESGNGETNAPVYNVT
ncbi:MAG TPA: hypothetical protein VH413_16215 [Verrucomicrobiae bacterium]|jgi:hypothetical protein|nr:hypothetical protein [Verrucomicrobiae bacterium]